MSEQVQYLTTPDPGFEHLYLQLREKENRIYSDSELKVLPYLKNHIHTAEWLLRVKTCNRFGSYLKARKFNGPVLDLGCGNGWFTHWLHIMTGNATDGADVNENELKQAALVFGTEHIQFYYADIFQKSPRPEYSLITLNACIQYFPEIEKLITRLRSLLEKNGEIHILDSPFYEDMEVTNASIRSKVYYKKMGAEPLSGYYHHHRKTEIVHLNGTILYLPGKGLMAKLKKDSPFPWVMFRK